jgi:hypothetical protein
MTAGPANIHLLHGFGFGYVSRIYTAISFDRPIVNDQL